MTYKGNGSGTLEERKKAVYSGGIETDIADSSLARAFITAAEDIEESWALTTFVDERQRNAYIRLYRKLLRHKVSHGLVVLKALLDSNPSIGGYNRAQAAMVGTGLIAAEALGVKLGSSSIKALNRAVEARAQRQERENDGKGG